jgi:N-formylglutamate amidohydrolase
MRPAPVRYLVGQRDFVLTLSPAIGVTRVTISVPHDPPGSEQELTGLLPTRNRGVRGKDVAVWPIVQDIALSAPIHVVRGLLPRSACDYNRAAPPGIRYDRYSKAEPDSAYEDAAIAPYWRAYHAAIAERVQSTLTSGVKPLLLDFHGFSRPAPYGDYDLILGTGNRRTVSSNVDLQFGAHLKACGYKVFVPADEPHTPGVDDYMDADHTVHAASLLGADAIQVEASMRFRAPGAKREGQRLARVVADFCHSYPTAPSA